MAFFAVIGTGLVALTHHQTSDRIAANEREALVKKLHALVPAETVDNDMATDKILVNAPDMLGGESIEVYRGRLQGKPVAAVFATIVPNGYSGPIKLLVAVRYDGTLGGVRVVSHKETPGLGDKVEEERSDWIFSFNDKSLSNPSEYLWKVKRDGSVFDQFTGATITPRSIATQQQDKLYVPSQTAVTEKQKASGDSDG